MRKLAKASVCGSPYLQYVSVVGAVDKVLQLSHTICFSQSKDELRLHVRLPGFLPGHLKKLHQILPVP